MIFVCFDTRLMLRPIAYLGKIKSFATFNSYNKLKHATAITNCIQLELHMQIGKTK